MHPWAGSEQARVEDARGGSRPRRRVFSEPRTFNRFFHGERDLSAQTRLRFARVHRHDDFDERVDGAEACEEPV
jgi:hypothetical protein